MNESEKVFADGFLFKRNESAPDFIVGNLSMDAKKAIEFINAMEADHITPWHLGGQTIAENCQMLCKDDNRRKGGR
jgi:hypothetical protein